jgi:hypothetical protein
MRQEQRGMESNAEWDTGAGVASRARRVDNMRVSRFVA